MADEADRTSSAAAARANIRETVKWLIAALAAVAAVIVGTSPLTGLGRASDAAHAFLAIGGSVVGLGSILAAIFLAARFLVAKPFFLADLKTNRPDLKSFVEAHAEDVLPPEITTLDGFLKKRDQIVDKLRELQAGPEKEKWKTAFASFQAYTRAASELAYFESERRAFIALGKALMILTIVAVAGLGCFAWAVAPAKDAENSPAATLKVTCLAAPQHMSAAGRQ